MKFKGRIEKIIDKSGVSKKDQKPFAAYQFSVKEEDVQCPQVGVFDTFGDKVQIPEVGTMVTVSFNLKGQEYEGKLFGKNDVWKIELAQTSGGTVMTAQQTAAPLAETTAPPVGEGSDLPF